MSLLLANGSRRRLDRVFDLLDLRTQVASIRILKGTEVPLVQKTFARRFILIS
jgi:hypothetical protein